MQMHLGRCQPQKAGTLFQFEVFGAIRIIRRFRSSNRTGRKWLITTEKRIEVSRRWAFFRVAIRAEIFPTHTFLDYHLFLRRQLCPVSPPTRFAVLTCLRPLRIAVKRETQKVNEISHLPPCSSKVCTTTHSLTCRHHFHVSSSTSIEHHFQSLQAWFSALSAISFCDF